MKQKRKLQELTFKDNFMFGAVMADEENCRQFLELAIEIPIKRVEVSKEKTLIYHPEYKGVRLDIYAKDEYNTHYNVEMQVVKKENLGKRTRYYHSQIDMELLLAGEDYINLPDTYVIFICDFDPFDGEKYRYTFENRCLENENLALQEGHKSIFLSTCGMNKEEVPEGLVKFLEFVKAGLSESDKDFEDEFVKRLQNSVYNVKRSREMEERFMTLEELLKDERAEAKAEGKAEGKAESILELLEELGTVPKSLQDKILEETDMTVLKKYLKTAAHSKSIEQFLKEIS